MQKSGYNMDMENNIKIIDSTSNSIDLTKTADSTDTITYDAESESKTAEEIEQQRIKDMENSQDYMVVDGHLIRMPSDWPDFTIGQIIQLKGLQFKVGKIKNARLELEGRSFGFRIGENVQISGYDFRVMKIKKGKLTLKPGKVDVINRVYKELKRASEIEQRSSEKSDK